MKKIAVLVCLVLVIGILVAGCGDQQAAKPAAPAQKVLKLGHNQKPESPFHIGSMKFAELVAQKSQNTMKIEVFHSSQMGDEAELSEAVRTGTMDISLIATGNVAKYEPRFNVTDLPYLFRDYAHVDKVLDGEVGQFLAAELEKKGQKILAYWESGFRHYVNNKKPVMQPEDMKGLRIRVPNFPVLTATTKALGANAVPMPFSEVYLACQQGVIDGQEGPAFAIRAAKMYEVQKYMVLDGHTYTPMVLIANPKMFQGLTPEQQKVIIEAAKEAGAFERKLIRDMGSEDLKYLETTGKMTIEKNPDKSKWREETKSVYAEFGDKYGKDLIQKIIDTK